MRVRRESIVLQTLPRLAAVEEPIVAVKSVLRAHTAAAMEQLSAQSVPKARWDYLMPPAMMAQAIVAIATVGIIKIKRDKRNAVIVLRVDILLQVVL